MVECTLSTQGGWICQVLNKMPHIKKLKKIGAARTMFGIS